MSYYEKIDGINYDGDLLNIARNQIKGKGDGRISESDMKNLMQNILDRNTITKTEYLTMFYILKNFNVTENALELLANYLVSKDT